MAKETKKHKEERQKKAAKAKAEAEKKLHAADAKKRKTERDEAEHKNKNLIYHKKPDKGYKMVKVKGLCNMHCADGYSLEMGKVCEITEAEAERLMKDVRMKFFEKA